MWPSWDYQFIASVPEIFLKVLGINMIFILLVYVTANTKLLNSVKPIVKGIQDLPAGEPVYIREKGLLSELAASINRTSEVLQRQKYQLRRKETARANWIAGVSHDIRTPLSMEMGCAGVSGEEIEKLNNTPHYMLCDQNTANQRHGLGLLIVKQIAVSHGGAAKIAHSPKGGLSVKIILPIRDED